MMSDERITHITNKDLQFYCGAGSLSNSSRGVRAFRFPEAGLTHWSHRYAPSDLQEEMDVDIERAESFQHGQVCTACKAEADRLIAVYTDNFNNTLEVNVENRVFTGKPSPRKMTPEWRDRIIAAPSVASLLEDYQQWSAVSHAGLMRTLKNKGKTYSRVMEILFEASLAPVLSTIEGLEVYPQINEELKNEPDHILKWRFRGAVQTLALEAKRAPNLSEIMSTPTAFDDLIDDIRKIKSSKWIGKISYDGALPVQNLPRRDHLRILNFVRYWIESKDPADYPGLAPFGSHPNPLSGFAPQALVVIGERTRIHIKLLPSPNGHDHPFSFGHGPRALVGVNPTKYGRIIREAAKQHSKKYQSIIVAIGELGMPQEHEIRSDLYGSITVHDFQDFSRDQPRNRVNYGHHEWLDSRNAVWKPGERPNPLAVISAFDANDGSMGKPILWCPPHSEVVRLGPMVQTPVLDQRFLHYSWQGLHQAGYT